MLYGTWSVVGVYRHFGLEAIALTLDAQWSEEVPPFFSSEPDHRGHTGRFTASHFGHVHSTSGGAEIPSSFDDFLHAVTPRESGDRRELFLAVNCPQLHKAALLRQWKAGGERVHVRRFVSSGSWHAAGRQLVTMMALRWPHCGVHGNYRGLEAALRKLNQPYVIWPDPHDRSKASMSCQCRAEPHDLASERSQMPSRLWRKLWYGKCRCNNRDCRDCCKRRYERLCAEMTRAWTAAIGSGKVAVITLTYRASAALTSRDWLRQASRDLARLREEWQRDWSGIPTHLWSVEFTLRGTPHFHVMVPWESDLILHKFVSWLRRTWSRIVGCGLSAATRTKRSVHVKVWGTVWPAVRYLLKSVLSPWPEKPVSPGTPRFRSWGCSRDLSPFRRKTRLAKQI